MLSLTLITLLTAAPPAPKHWVTDDAQMIDAAAQRRLDRRLESLEHTTGYELLIWTGKDTGGEPIESFAGRTFARWKQRHPRLDHGAILFVTPEQTRLEVGHGLQHVFTPEVSKRILDEKLGPMLAAGEPEVAFSSVVDSFAGTLTGAPAPATPTKDRVSTQQWMTMLVAALAFLLMFFIARPESYRWFFSQLLSLRRSPRRLSSQH